MNDSPGTPGCVFDLYGRIRRIHKKFMISFEKIESNFFVGYLTLKLL